MAKNNIWLRAFLRVQSILPRRLQAGCAHFFSTVMLTYVLLVAHVHAVKDQVRSLWRESEGSVIKLVFLVSLYSSLWLYRLLLIPFYLLNRFQVWPTMRVSDYVERYGYGCEDHIVTTADGYHLLLHHLFAKDELGRRRNASKPFPVLLQHGLLQSAGVFVTSGRRSMAFWFLDRGYDVWLGNNRGVPCDPTTSRLQWNGRGHESLSTDDDAFWEWTLDDLGRYDFPALIHFVLEQTGKRQLHYIGHSQGNAQAFIGLTLHPHLHDHVKSFTALAPAASIGSLIQRWPIREIIHMSVPGQRETFLAVFAQKGFLPLMHWLHRHLPMEVFTELAHSMFAFLFDWTDRNWDVTRKVHYYRFTPRPTSSRAILHWTDIAKRGLLSPFTPCKLVKAPQKFMSIAGSPVVSPQGRVIFDVTSGEPSPVNSDEALLNVYVADTAGLDREYDLSVLHRVPLLLVWGSKDYLIDPEKMLTAFDGYGHRGRKMNIHMQEGVEGYEHLDFLWSTDADFRVWSKVHMVFEKLEQQR